MRLEKEVIEWANKKDLIENGNSYAQYAKFMEEANEILVAMNKRRGCSIPVEGTPFTERVMSEKCVKGLFELQDALGDTLVTLIILAAQYGLELEDCLEYAYNEIKDRTGKTVGGTFIKD